MPAPFGVSYYSSNQIDRALAQFDHSLSVDPAHTKTLLNRTSCAFGKQDLEGATKSWGTWCRLPRTARKPRARSARRRGGAHPVTPGAPAAPAGRGGAGL
ncbi:MAG: hypothetical protein IPL75_13255 [Acidobacteria bacterium]|nr:hypothetical protein [Acidobacteriota bacterium]